MRQTSVARAARVHTGRRAFQQFIRRTLRACFNKQTLMLAAAVLLPGIGLAAQAPLDLRSTSRFAILAGSEITSVPASAIKGDVGLSPGARSGIAGLTAPEVAGTIFAADDGGAVAVLLTQAQGDLTTAYNDAAGRTLEFVDVANANLGGRTLAPGLYKSSGTLEITGNLTLDAGGDPNAVYIFQMASSLNTAAGSQVILSGGASAANIFWQVGSSATLGTTSVFKGTIMADQSISLATGASLEGRALARIGAVTLDASNITVPTRSERPRFDSIERESSASVKVVITSSPGVALTLQTSSDLIQWTTLATFTPGLSPHTFTDTTAAAAPMRFYRAFNP